jgi:cytochrome oxidase Cu insertion factor (SCO1/SenC/PrrC family)
LAALFLLSLTLGASKTDKPSVGYYPGEQIPNFALNDAFGKRLDLDSYKGKKVVINFWAAYDAPSRATNVLLNDMLKSHRDLVFLSVSFDENRTVFEKTVRWDNIEPHSQFCDANGSKSKLYKEFKLNKGFKSYLIDENGVIVAMNVSPEKLESVL